MLLVTVALVMARSSALVPSIPIRTSRGQSPPPRIRDSRNPLRSLARATHLVHSQRGLCVMGYSVRYETSNLCSGTLGRGARTHRSRAALERRLRDAPLPDPSCERRRKISPEDSQKPRMRLANGQERHPSLQREGPRRPHPWLLSAQARACRLRRGECRVFEGDAPPLSEGVRARVEPLDFGDGRRGSFRGGFDRRAGLGGDHPGHPLAPSFGEVDASPRRWITSPDPLYERKKGGATG